MPDRGKKRTRRSQRDSLRSPRQANRRKRLHPRDSPSGRARWLQRGDAVHLETRGLSYSGSKMVVMAAEKYSASMDDVLLGDARADAEAEGRTLSSWLADAAADRLRLKALRRVVDEWEAEHGAISVGELDALEDKVAKARRDAQERRRRAGTKPGRAVVS